MRQDSNTDRIDAIRERILSERKVPSPASWEAIDRRVHRGAALRRAALAAVALPLAALLLWNPFGRPSGPDPEAPAPTVAEHIEVPSPADPSVAELVEAPSSADPAPAQNADQAEQAVLLPQSDRSRLADGLSAERQPTPRTRPTAPDSTGQRPQANAQPPHQLPLESESSTKTGQNVDEKANTGASSTNKPQNVDEVAPSATLLAFNDPTPQQRFKYSVSLGAIALSAGKRFAETRQMMDLYPIAVNRLNTMMEKYKNQIMGPGSKTSQKDQARLMGIWSKWYQDELEMLEWSRTVSPPENWTGFFSAKWHHDIPISASLALSVALDSRFTLETGLEYTYLHSVEDLSGIEIQDWFGEGPMPLDGQDCLNQHVHYIGIPFRLIYRAWSPGHWDVYAGVGIKGDKCVKAQLGVEKQQERHLQWSAEAFGGIQYSLWNRAHLYFQPALTWYFTQSDLITYRTENPLGLSLQAGLRFDLR